MFLYRKLVGRQAEIIRGIGGNHDYPLVLPLLNNLSDVHYSLFIEVGHRFIEEEQARIVNQRTDILHPLRHSGTECAKQIESAWCKSKILEKRTSNRFVELQAAKSLHKLCVFPGGKFAVELKIWGYEANVKWKKLLGDDIPIDGKCDCPTASFRDIRDDLQKR